jgi:hypothetical protein
MFEHFLNQPVVVETGAGPIVGVLIRAHMGIYGHWHLLVHAFAGSWWLISNWWSIKSGRSSV